MVYESRVGDVFTLGTTSWRIEQITHDQVLVSPAPGVPGRLPFWKGDSPARPAELGEAFGAFVREMGALSTDAQARDRLSGSGLDACAADNLISYLREQQQPTGALPTDQTIVFERFRDELGDWRVCVHSPLGRACCRRGRWPSSTPPGSATASRCRPPRPTTASCCGSPTPSPNRRVPT